MPHNEVLSKDNLDHPIFIKDTWFIIMCRVIICNVACSLLNQLNLLDLQLSWLL